MSDASKPEASETAPEPVKIPEAVHPQDHRRALGMTIILLALLVSAGVGVALSFRDQEQDTVRAPRSTPSLISAEELEQDALRREQAAIDGYRQRLEMAAPQPAPRPVPRVERRASPPPRQALRMPTSTVPRGVTEARQLSRRPPEQAVQPDAWRPIMALSTRGPVLRAGTFIPARLMTPVTSASSGHRPVLAMVSHDVRDAGHRQIVIPVGSRLLGRLVGDVSPGRERAVIAWDRLDLPDGRAFALGGLEASATDGSPGVPGEVDHHWRALYGHAFLTSLVGGLAQVSQRSDGTIGASTGEIFASGLGRDLSRVTEDVVGRALRRPSTLTIPSGRRLAILVTRDVVFGGDR